MQTAATGGTSGSSDGRRAFAQSDATFPGVSLPSRVVKSTIETAVVRPHNLDFFLIERVWNLATRSSIPTWSTVPTSSKRRRKAELFWVLIQLVISWLENLPATVHRPAARSRETGLILLIQRIDLTRSRPRHAPSVSPAAQAAAKQALARRLAGLQTPRQPR